MMDASSDVSTITATGWDKSFKMNRGFDNTLITRVCRNKATDYEMLLYGIALQNDKHFAEIVRGLQLDWIADGKEPRALERLRRANVRLNKGEKLPPLGPPLMSRDSPPLQLTPCQCRITRDKVPWNSPTYWEGASTELRDALAKRSVPTGSPQATITSQKPISIRTPKGPGAQSTSQELSALVRAAAGSADRREKCTKLIREDGTNEEMCMFAHVIWKTIADCAQNRPQ